MSCTCENCDLPVANPGVAWAITIVSDGFVTKAPTDNSLTPLPPKESQ